MASGDHRASASLLDRLAVTGLEGANLVHLTIKRLARLGRHGELLRLPEFKSVVASIPPAPVREAILDAIYSVVIEDSAMLGNLAESQQALAPYGDAVTALAEGSTAGFSVGSITVLAVAAHAAHDHELLATLRQEEHAWQAIKKLFPILDRPAYAATTVAPARPTPPSTFADVASWNDLLTAIAFDRDVRPIVAEERWRDWPAVVEVDSDIANLCGQLDDTGADRLWSIVGSFIDSDSYQRPAARTAHELLLNAVTP